MNCISIGVRAGLAVAVVLLAAAALAQPLKLFVTIPPQEYVVERLGGANVEVQVMVGQGQSPHNFEPTARQMAALSDADGFFSVGIPLEKVLLPKVLGSNPDLKVVDSRAAIALIAMAEPHGHHDEEHHDEVEEARDDHRHEEGELDPHFWLDPRRMKKMAHNIAKGLVGLAPQHKEAFEANLAALEAELDGLDARLREVLAPLRGEEFFVYHPAFGYLADAYGLKQVAVEVEGKEPSAKQLARLIDHAKDEGVKVIFVQAQFSSRSAETLAQSIGGVVIPLDPLARDYVKNLEEIARQLSDRQD